VGLHSYKFGVVFRRIYDGDLPRSSLVPSIAGYLAAKNGSNPFGYSSMTDHRRS
jgi:hypothetical protein